jgi:WD40 repeat protein
VSALAWHPSGTQLAVAAQNGTGPASANLVRIFNATTGQLITTIYATYQGFNINSIAWNPANADEIAAGSVIGYVVVWNTQTGEEEVLQTVQRLDPNREPELAETLPSVTSIGWRSDGTRLAAGTDDGTVFLWNTTTTPWQQVAAIPGGSINQIRWSSDDRLAVADGQQISMMNPETQQILDTIDAGFLVRSISWSPDASQLVYGTNEGLYQTVVVPPPVTCTYTTATVADLRTAISSANSNPAAETICLSTGAIYTFNDGPYSSDGPNALPTITGELTIYGNNATLTRAAGAPNFRFFRVNGDSSLTLRDMTLSSGNPGGTNKGGVVRSVGTLHIVNSTLTGNSAPGGGGAVNVVQGIATITDSTLSNNTTTNAAGGALYISGGTTTLTNTTLSGNSVPIGSWSGGGIFLATGTLNINGGTISGNTGRNGGGVFVSNGTITIDGTLFENNTAGNHGGGFYINAGSVMMSSVRFEGNTATNLGGGLSNNALITITNSLFDSNSAGTNGGAILNDSTAASSVSNSCITNNTAAAGSGIYSYEANFDARNNWWGSASGPGTAINSNVLATPFLTEGCPVG